MIARYGLLRAMNEAKGITQNGALPRPAPSSTSHPWSTRCPDSITRSGNNENAKSLNDAGFRRQLIGTSLAP